MKVKVKYSSQLHERREADVKENGARWPAACPLARLAQSGLKREEQTD